MQARNTRASGPLLDPNIIFPEVPKTSTQLPDNASVIGLIKYHIRKGTGVCSERDVLREVAKLVYSKWWHDTVYCISLEGIVYKMSQLYKQYRDGWLRLKQGRETSAAAMKYKELVETRNHLFDIFPNDPKLGEKRIEHCKLDWGVKMSPAEKSYYEDQKITRKQFCDRAVDPVWYTAMMKKQRLRERGVEAQEQMTKAMEYKSLAEIEKVLTEDGALEDSPLKVNAVPDIDYNENESNTVKRKLEDDNESDYLPIKFRHVRDSDRKVKEGVYRVVADLIGRGLSLNESVHAITIISNGLFSRNWFAQEKCENERDTRDMLPSLKSIREALSLIETQALSQTVDKMVEGRSKGSMVTHAIDSTTKRGLGQFAAQGIHIGRESALPMPLINICGESTNDIALQIDQGFHCLAISKGIPVEEVYKLVSTHMTDSVEHNKGFNKILQEMYSLDEPAGQLFCGSHTTLGFSSAMDKLVIVIEEDMKISHITSKFMVGLDADSKNSSVAGTALDIMLKLVAPEYSHKMWNYYNEFCLYLDTHKVEKVMFAYKDQRFGCLSRAAAVLLFLYEHLANFLTENTQIVNKLACLARELLELPYIKTVFLVFAAIGIHIIEPFYVSTIQTGATHTSLKKFYKELYDGMDTTVDITFFQFGKPEFSAVSAGLFEGVKSSYGTNVIDVVKSFSAEFGEEGISLVNFMLPKLRQVLGRQRRDYCLDQTAFPAQFPVEQQAENIDDCPVTNLEMERFCGKVDYRQNKLKKLTAISRSIILGKVKSADGEETNFRNFKQQTLARRELQLKWSDKMKEKFKAGADLKQISALQKEKKRLDKLEILKKAGGPFTDALEVEKFLADSQIKTEQKKHRMKMEMQFARDSSTTLPKVDPLFRIQVVLPNKKRRDKTAVEFGESLMVFLGKKADRSIMDYSAFKISLNKLSM